MLQRAKINFPILTPSHGTNSPATLALGEVASHMDICPIFFDYSCQCRRKTQRSVTRNRARWYGFQLRAGSRSSPYRCIARGEVGYQEVRNTPPSRRQSSIEALN